MRLDSTLVVIQSHFVFKHYIIVQNNMEVFKMSEEVIPNEKRQTMENETSTKKSHNNELLNLILKTDINIEDLVNKAFDYELLSPNIHPTTFLAGVKRLNKGIPRFVDGESKHVDLLYNLAKRMLTEVEIYINHNGYNLPEEDYITIKCYIILICFYIFNWINKEYLTEAIASHWRGVHSYRRHLIYQAKDELCKKIASKSLHSVLITIISETHSDYSYTALIDEDVAAENFKILLHEFLPFEHTITIQLPVHY